jgi:hypothetical protein
MDTDQPETGIDSEQEQAEAAEKGSGWKHYEQEILNPQKQTKRTKEVTDY